MLKQWLRLVMLIPPKPPLHLRRDAASVRAQSADVAAWAAFWERHHAATWAWPDPEAVELGPVGMTGRCGAPLVPHDGGLEYRRFSKKRAHRWMRITGRRLLDAAPARYAHHW